MRACSGLKRELVARGLRVCLNTGEFQMTRTTTARFHRALGVAILPAAVALALTACGGGGSSVRPTPPPATPPPPTGIGFTPTVANDASLVVNPPAVPALAAPRDLGSQQLSAHLQLTNAAGALGAGLTGQGVTIGVLDSGVDRNHPGLSPRVTRNIMPPSNWTGFDRSVDDKVGHGTTVALLAAGSPVNAQFSGGQTGLWPGGVAQASSIVSWRFIRDERPVDDGTDQGGNEIKAGEGYGDFFKSLNSDLANAGAKIINNSWGGLYWNDPGLTVELANAYKDFIVSRGGLVVFANGNSGDSANPDLANNPSDNAALPSMHGGDPVLERGWLTVGALDPDNPTQLTDYSQKCGVAMNYCLVAPGDAVFPLRDSAGVLRFYGGGGTSYAAPLVSGAAAVVWSAFPYFTNDLVRQTILAAAKDLGAPGVDPVFGWGLLDVTKAAMGPSNFAWGDVNVSVTGNSVWRNAIVGSGGLVKNGSGNLTLTETASYTGATRVEAGGLSVRKGMASHLTVGSGGTVWGSGAFGGNVVNNGRFLSGANVPASIAGNFSQSASGNLGVWLGSKLNVGGSASVAGTMSILGVRSGYTTTAKETLLTATGGVTGTFSTLRAASNVFLDANLGYDPNNVFLNINRIDVTQAIAGAGLGGITAMSASRVETAMQAIDQQLQGAGGGGIGSGFIDAAGALQQSWSIANADYSLRSLSGELHAASAAMTFDAIDAGRRAMDSRLATLARSPQRAGGWSRDLASSGHLAQSGFDGIGMDASGQMIGNDWRVGGNAVLGVAMNRLEQSSWLGDFGDRSRGRQSELQLYGAAWQGPWQAQAQLVSGRFDRQMQRNLLLGGLRDGVASQLSGNYQGVHAEVGRLFEAGGFDVMPYLGSQYVRLSNDGFDEGGDTGFGLRAEAWEASRWQALGGLRAERGWRVGGLDLRANARAEWQHTLAADGFAFDASYRGVEQWAPLQGIGLASRSQLLGIGLSALHGGNLFRFDLSRRASEVGDTHQASVQFLRRF